MLAYAVAVLGLNLLVGYSGQISLGHGAFFALGAYTAAILIEKAGLPHLLTLPAAGALCFVAGLLFGVPALRLRGLYLALVTLGLAIATPQLIKRFDGLTGGTQGLNVAAARGPGLARLLADDQFLYLLTLAIAVAMFVLAARIVRGPRRPRAGGRPRRRDRRAHDRRRPGGHKTRAFAVSAAYAGVAARSTCSRSASSRPSRSR